MFRLHWGVVARNEKDLMGEVKALATTKSKSLSVEDQMFTQMKRKRRDSDDSVKSAESCNSKEKKPELLSHAQASAVTNHLNDLYSPSNEQIFEQRNADSLSYMNRRVGMNPSTFDENVSTAPPAVLDPSQNDENRMDVDSLQNPVNDLERKALQEAIEAQFNLEILLKHNELRLIDQELAKCQIALEQLRRCRVIPFPALSCSIEDMQSVSNGLGTPATPAVGCQQAPKPPPWGTVEGPYSRHYAKWLLPDPTFDGVAIEESKISRRAGKKVPERSTRGSKAEKSTTTTIASSRSQRGSIGSRLHALPAGYSEPKEEKGPMIVKRSTDGQMVKLVCLDCRRENFNSAQGFINHCRIAHSRGFASHDAAALACGEKVELNEAGALIVDPSGAGLASAGLVHPLIRSALVGKSAQPITMTPTNKRKRSQGKSDPLSHVRAPITQTSHPAPPSRQRPVIPPLLSSELPFIPSRNAPHLSALFVKSGLGGDLNDLVKEATVKSGQTDNLGEEEEDSDVDMEDAAAPEPSDGHHLSTNTSFIRGGRLTTRATMSPAPLDCSSANKGAGPHTRKPGYLHSIHSHTSYCSPYTAPTTQRATLSSAHTHLLGNSSPVNLSPNTVESNTAPSLVSDDDEEYDDAHSESDTPSSAVDEDGDGYPEIEVEDEEAEGPNVDPELATAPKAHPARRASALRSPATIRGHGDRHVSFQSPVKKEGRHEG